MNICKYKIFVQTYFITVDVNKSNGDYTLLTTAEVLQKFSQYFAAFSYNMTLETLRYNKG